MSYRSHACALMLFGAAMILVGCSLPWHRQPPDTSAAGHSRGSDQTQAAECASLRDQLKDNREAAREAPTTSINEDIVAATEAKSDQNIQDLQAQYDALGCPAADLPPQRQRTAPLPPAPGGLSP